MQKTVIPAVINEILNECKEGGPYIFRGTTTQYSKEDKGINSSLYRKFKDDFVWTEYFRPPAAEKEIVENAKKLFSKHTSNIEILTDLRHYDGAVNLIDFSRDLYVALFFACNGKMKENGELIMLDTNKIGKTDDIDYKKTPPSPSISIIEPAHSDTSRHRVALQSSVFVYAIKGYIETDKGYIETEIERGRTHPIPASEKQEVLDYLRNFHNISHNTIYNDIVGFISNEENYSSARIEFYKGLAHNKKGEHKEAIGCYNKAIEIEPLSEAHNNRGTSKLKLGQYKDAIKDYDKAIEINPKHAEAYNNRGVAKAKLKQHEEAIKDYDKAIEINSKNADAYNNRGIAKQELGDTKGANEDFEMAKKLEKENAQNDA